MAEFCKKHARELGLKADSYPMFCEGCDKYVEKPKPSLKNIINWLINLPNLRSNKYWRGG